MERIKKFLTKREEATKMKITEITKAMKKRSTHVLPAREETLCRNQYKAQR